MKTNCDSGLCVTLPPRGKGVRRQPRYEPRPRRPGEVSESRRLAEGFAMLNGEGVYDERYRD